MNMTNTSQVMTERALALPNNAPLSPSQYSEAVSIVSPSEYLAARPNRRVCNPPQAPTTSVNASTHGHSEDQQSQSQYKPTIPSPTQPIYINPNQSRKRAIERLAPLGFSASKSPLEAECQEPPLPGQIHHRADQVSHYRLLGTRGWEGFQQQRIADSQAEIGVIDTAWAANGGGTILDFGVRKTEGWGARARALSTILEEDEDWDERKEERRGK